VLNGLATLTSPIVRRVDRTSEARESQATPTHPPPSIHGLHRAYGRTATEVSRESWETAGALCNRAGRMCPIPCSNVRRQTVLWAAKQIEEVHVVTGMDSTWLRFQRHPGFGWNMADSIGAGACYFGGGTRAKTLGGGRRSAVESNRKLPRMPPSWTGQWGMRWHAG